MITLDELGRVNRTRLAVGPILGATIGVTMLASVPAIAADRDRDGLRDGFERRWEVTTAASRDSDADGVVDPAEDPDGDRLSNLGEQRFGSDPGDPDTDGDGRIDGLEDADRDGISNAREQDQRRVPRRLRPALRAAADDSPAIGSHCLAPYGRSTVRHCVLGASASSTSVAIFGDSHAIMWVPALARAGTQQGWRIETLLKAGCPSVHVRTISQHRIDGGRTCQAWRSGALRWLRRHPPDLIIITNADAYQLVSPRGGSPNALRRRLFWKQGLARTLAGLPRSSGVLVLGDTPKNTRDPIPCLQRHLNDMSACASRRVPSGSRRYHGIERAVAEAAGAQFATLDSKVCSYDPCPLVQGDVLIWRDRGHLTATFARQLTPALRSIVRAALYR